MKESRRAWKKAKGQKKKKVKIDNIDSKRRRLYVIRKSAAGSWVH